MREGKRRKRKTRCLLEPGISKTQGSTDFFIISLAIETYLTATCTSRAQIKAANTLGSQFRCGDALVEGRRP